MDTIVKYLVLPSSLVMLSAIAGLALLCFRSTRNWGVSLSVIALFSYLIFGSGPVAFLLLGHLEYQIQPATPSERAAASTIVVLAGHAESDIDVPVSSRVNSASAFRLLEALSLFQSAPDSRVIVSGAGAVPRIMRDVLVSAGIPADRIQVEAGSSSTFESTEHLASTLGNSPFHLVTSAGHMPRAMRVFEKAGMTPRAVPTHYLVRRNWLAIQYLPSPLYLAYTDLAVSEYVALFWYRLRGWA